MNLGMDEKQRKSVLGLVSNGIAPWFSNAERLMDFLTDSYDVGGSTSLLALSGLFYLIQEKNLDYPSFYPKLYSLLDADVLHSRYRSRFFRLLDDFLGSTHLPAALVASFIKRLSRLTLYAPPAAIVVVIPWVYNLLKKHPTCTFMIHREADHRSTAISEDHQGMDDPFDDDATDPMQTGALESSLWEIHMLQSHYHPNVATLANIISEQFTKQAYNLEDFLDHSYATVCEFGNGRMCVTELTYVLGTRGEDQMIMAELSKEIKKPPAIEYRIPKRILTHRSDDQGQGRDLLRRLWRFE